MLLTDEEYATLERSARAILIKRVGRWRPCLRACAAGASLSWPRPGEHRERTGPCPSAHAGARRAKGRPVTAPRVLVVDDCQVNIVIAQTVLLAENFDVETAADGLEAIQKVASFGPDLILMDVQMPGMDGIEVTRILKADLATRHIRIVAFTGYALRDDEAKMRAAGCDAYLSKPIDVRRFGGQVRTCLQTSMGDDPGEFGRVAA